MPQAAVPLVSAVIPAHNAERFLGDAVRSVLAQSYGRVECLVVDDGSTDGTAEVASSFGARVRLIAQCQAGSAAARNRGAAEARGDLLAFLDADDTWRPTRLERQLDALRSAGAEACLCANTVTGHDPPMGRVVRLRPLPPTAATLLTWEGTVVSTGSNLLIDRDAFAAMGGFTASLLSAEDFELLVRLVLRARLIYLDELLVDYRWHDANATRDLAAIEAALRSAYELIFARDGFELGVSRRRAAAGLHRYLAAAHLRTGGRRRGMVHALRAVALDPRLLWVGLMTAWSSKRATGEVVARSSSWPS